MNPIKNEDHVSHMPTKMPSPLAFSGESERQPPIRYRCRAGRRKRRRSEKTDLKLRQRKNENDNMEGKKWQLT